MVIQLAANNLLLQNDFLIWEELLLCENINSEKFIEKVVLFLENTGCSSELAVKRKEEKNQFNFEKMKFHLK